MVFSFLLPQYYMNILCKIFSYCIMAYKCNEADYRLIQLISASLFLSNRYATSLELPVYAISVKEKMADRCLCHLQPSYTITIYLVWSRKSNYELCISVYACYSFTIIYIVSYVSSSSVSASIEEIFKYSLPAFFAVI